MLKKYVAMLNGTHTNSDKVSTIDKIVFMNFHPRCKSFSNIIVAGEEREW